MALNFRVDNPTLAANLRALGRRDGPLVGRLVESESAALEFSYSKSGPLTATLRPKADSDEEKAQSRDERARGEAQTDPPTCAEACATDDPLASAGTSSSASGSPSELSPQPPSPRPTQPTPSAQPPQRKAVHLASRYDPEREAGKLVERIDYDKTACVVVLGFGLGYHARKLAHGLGETGLVIIYEPDLSVLRAVLERIDHSDWLGQANVMVCDHTTDQPSLTARVSPLASVLTQGTTLLAHPPTRMVHREAIDEFSKFVTEAVAFCRTNVTTALVNSARTCRNLACNLDLYAAGPTTNELHNAAKGWPAVCVAAGPSLVKNAHLLADPKLRRRVVVIAVQTTLRPLLDRGIRPDFVTALDYSPICARFYESLPAMDDVTLVVEPKAHPAIIDAYPGPVRVTQNTFNDRLLGPNDVPAEVSAKTPAGPPARASSSSHRSSPTTPEQAQPATSSLYRPIKALKSGATVAHLSFYLAQHLGCDPIMFIGQDLGFSDGLYYVPGTATWDVWAPELNPFNTVETMEWQRIARGRGSLRRKEDIHGRPIFADEQMLTYLKQFESDFAEADRRGHTVIDATEGGMPKQHAITMPLAEALDEYAGAGPWADTEADTDAIADADRDDRPRLPHTDRSLDPARLHRLTHLLARREREVQDLRRTSLRTVRLLKEMKTLQGRSKEMRKLFAKVKKNQQHVEGELAQAFTLVNMLNTMGTYKRQQADRTINRLEARSSEKQRRQIERDLVNLDWLIQASDEALSILDEASTRTRTRCERQQAGESIAA